MPCGCKSTAKLPTQVRLHLSRSGGDAIASIDGSEAGARRRANELGNRKRPWVRSRGAHERVAVRREVRTGND